MCRKSHKIFTSARETSIRLNGFFVDKSRTDQKSFWFNYYLRNCICIWNHMKKSHFEFVVATLYVVVILSSTVLSLGSRYVFHYTVSGYRCNASNLKSKSWLACHSNTDFLIFNFYLYVDVWYVGFHIPGVSVGLALQALCRPWWHAQTYAIQKNWILPSFSLSGRTHLTN